MKTEHGKKYEFAPNVISDMHFSFHNDSAELICEIYTIHRNDSDGPNDVNIAMYDPEEETDFSMTVSKENVVEIANKILEMFNGKDLPCGCNACAAAEYAGRPTPSPCCEASFTE